MPGLRSSCTIHNMAAKRDRYNDGSSVTGVDEYPGDASWRKENGLHQPFMLQILKPGYKSKASRSTIEAAGALHPDYAEVIESLHVILWSCKKKKALYTAMNLDDVLHFTYPSVDDVINTVREFNEQDGVDIGLSLYYPDQSHTDNDCLKVYFEGTDEWETVSQLHDKLDMNVMAKNLLAMDEDRSDRGNYQITRGLAAIAFKKDDVTTVWKPTIRKGTNAKNVENMNTLTKILHSTHGAGVFFRNEERSKVFANE